MEAALLYPNARVSRKRRQEPEQVWGQPPVQNPGFASSVCVCLLHLITVQSVGGRWGGGER